MYFSYIRSPGWSGKVCPQKTPGPPQEPETPLHKDHKTVVFSVELKGEEELMTLNELVAKYPPPEVKS